LEVKALITMYFTVNIFNQCIFKVKYC